MKTVIVMTLVVVFALPAAGFDLGARAPAKPAGNTAPPPPDPAVVRQGGDTLADAVPLPLPAIDVAGTTVGYNDDYYEMCPYGQSYSPDVVYSIAPEYDRVLDVDLCGSSYETHVFVYDAVGHIVGCNSDYYFDEECGYYTSKIEAMPVAGGEEYFVVIDGINDESGPYLLNIYEHVPCVVECPPGAVLEDEPPLAIDYADQYNGGCNSDMLEPVFQVLDAPVFCGVGGFFINEGSSARDTDWFLVDIPSGGVLEITGDAEEETYVMEVAPHDCSSASVMQHVIIGQCRDASISITGEPGSTIWLFVGANTFWSPDGSDVFEYDYVLVTNLDAVATENYSWTDVKSLFD